MNTDKAASIRIIDANFNRAREALRVMEEYARFALNDGVITQSAKSLRHELRDVVQRALGDEMTHFRNIETDVGTEARTSAEYHRDDLQGVAAAACKRLAEALRVVEEYGKMIGPDLAARVEQLRYSGYRLEQQIAACGLAWRRFGQVRVYVIITEAHCRLDWLDTAREAIKGGASCLQLREKELPSRELLSRAREFVSLCRQFNVISVINDRPDIAALAGADAVHLGQDDLTVSDVRRIMPPTALVGVSTHSVEQAIAAVATGPDYVAVGPVFATTTKPRPFVAGSDTLSKIKSKISLPLVAIGGITVSNAPGVIDAGADCLCVCTAVTGSESPSEVVGALKAAFATVL
ncbi:MAG: thiamine phosphate synthase [Planctomycetota bacterium]